MATISTIADDFDSLTLADTATFFVSGKQYAIDLNEERQAQLQDVLAEFEGKMGSYVTKARAVD
ncbi:MAG: hypothetical protein DI613_16990 [Kocuria rhizophila]|uniref:Lsr2 dimerization domain-containing protein n=1 Tax=Micrococcus endophyticus TaxID=455343 RepID=UPI000DB50656|nr:Lsr2 family protein [Micrococcus endophyticus]PZP24607.1 MAG: hypothetical protein DI613_16990 [Kocuria rhizophila]